ncbi:Rab family GTPase [Anaerolineales bacterium HSG24]|nr:Rab family GTPase [Anaerolineales bacterium HSG24]
MAIINNKPLFQVKVILAGDGAVGKSSLLRRYVFHDFIDEHKMTIGMDAQSKLTRVPGLGVVKVHMWDLAGQPQWASVREGFYLGSHAMALVFDVSRAETIQELPNWIKECRKKAPGIPVLMVANKIDLPHRVPVKKIARWTKEQGYEYIETSPKTGLNVDIMFKQLGIMGVNFVLKRR